MQQQAHWGGHPVPCRREGAARRGPLRWNGEHGCKCTSQTLQAHRTHACACAHMQASVTEAPLVPREHPAVHVPRAMEAAGTWGC